MVLFPTSRSDGESQHSKNVRARQTSTGDCVMGAYVRSLRLALIVSIVLGCASEVRAQGTGSVTGVLYDAVTGLPATNGGGFMTVRLFDENGIQISVTSV